MTTEVHIDWQGTTHFVGLLHTPERGASASFEYAAEWLSRADAFALDPSALPLQRPAHHATVLHGAFQDAGPDRWGRLLIERAVRKKVLAQKPWRDLDYVLALDDVSRIGALRFRDAGGGDFLAHTTGKLPPLVRLGTLIQAADAIHHESETAADLRFLLAEGSPLGGARPKSAVLLKDGSLGIAKFPKPDARRDIAAGEILALTLARRAGMTVADHQLVTAAGRNVSVITRFDRHGPQRVPFISAATLLGLSHDQSAAYTMIADAIRQFGDDVTRDLHELWRRMVFSLLASNCDDHARNHGFLMHRPGRWSLSPAYDLNPVPEIERAQLNKTAISEDNDEPGIAAALSVAARFALKPAQARKILREVFEAVQSWHEVGKNSDSKQAHWPPMKARSITRSWARFARFLAHRRAGESASIGQEISQSLMVDSGHLMRIVVGMNVALTSHFDAFIKQLITSGRYNNASEVVRAALRKLQEIEGESFPPGSLAHLYTFGSNREEGKLAR